MTNTVDPIFAAIDATKDAMSRFEQCMSTDIQAGDIDDEQRLCDVACECHTRLVDMHPTTLDGVIAKLDFIGPLHAEGNFCEDEKSTLEYLRNDLAYLAGLPLIAPSNRLN